MGNKNSPKEVKEITETPPKEPEMVIENPKLVLDFEVPSCNSNFKGDAMVFPDGQMRVILSSENSNLIVVNIHDPKNTIVEKNLELRRNFSYGWCSVLKCSSEENFIMTAHNPEQRIVVWTPPELSREEYTIELEDHPKSTFLYDGVFTDEKKKRLVMGTFSGSIFIFEPSRFPKGKKLWKNQDTYDVQVDFIHQLRTLTDAFVFMSRDKRIRMLRILHMNDEEKISGDLIRTFSLKLRPGCLESFIDMDSKEEKIVSVHTKGGVIIWNLNGEAETRVKIPLKYFEYAQILKLNEQYLFIAGLGNIFSLDAQKKQFRYEFDNDIDYNEIFCLKWLPLKPNDDGDDDKEEKRGKRLFLQIARETNPRIFRFSESFEKEVVLLPHHDGTDLLERGKFLVDSVLDLERRKELFCGNGQFVVSFLGGDCKIFVFKSLC